MISQGVAIEEMIKRRSKDPHMSSPQVVEYLANLLALSTNQVSRLIATDSFTAKEMEVILTATGYVLAYIPVEEIKSLPIC